MLTESNKPEQNELLKCKTNEKKEKILGKREKFRQNAYTADLCLNCCYYFTTLFDAETCNPRQIVYKYGSKCSGDTV